MLVDEFLSRTLLGELRRGDESFTGLKVHPPQRAQRVYRTIMEIDHRGTTLYTSTISSTTEEITEKCIRTKELAGSWFDALKECHDEKVEETEFAFMKSDLLNTIRGHVNSKHFYVLGNLASINPSKMDRFLEENFKNPEDGYRIFLDIVDCEPKKEPWEK